MEPEERRKRLNGYFTYYYSELQRRLPDYTDDPESVPHILRPYDRIVQFVECRDGYLVLHKADPENEHNTNTATTFELKLSYRDQTVGELTERDLPSDAPFWGTEAFYLKEQETGEYVATEPWERRDFISNRRIEQWTSDRPIAQTGEEGIEQAAKSTPCRPRSRARLWRRRRRAALRGSARPNPPTRRRPRRCRRPARTPRPRPPRLSRTTRRSL
jgi:hypothetical protein